MTDEELRLDIKAYIRYGGNKSEAARQRGLSRKSYCKRLEQAERRFSIKLNHSAGGALEPVEIEARSLPEPGCVKRYIITSAQNDTKLHEEGWINLSCYADWLDSLPNSSCEIIVGTYTYQGNPASAKLQKQFCETEEGQWFAPELHPFITNKRVELAPGLVFCGELNILPTTAYPLADLDTYNDHKSNIVPAAKLALRSVDSLPSEDVKMNYTTGTITQRNYIKARAGLIAEQYHSYGGLIVEVDCEGTWFVRQLQIDASGRFFDAGPKGWGARVVRTGGANFGAEAEAITWGDIHAADMDRWVYNTAFGFGAMLDSLRPRYQFLHDVFSMRSGSHHESGNFHASYAKHAAKENSVEAEVKYTAELLNSTTRDFSTSYIVASNHDRHLDIWLNESSARKDLDNVKYHTILQTAMLDMLDSGRKKVSLLEFALRRAGLLNEIKFIKEDESFVICKQGKFKGIECGLHGDRGVSGSRGSTASLAKLGRHINKGHDHTATILNYVYSAGACSQTYHYQRGPTKSSISHIVTWPNGTRQIITMKKGKWRA